MNCNNRPLGYERVYLPLYKVAETPIHIQGDLTPNSCITVTIGVNSMYRDRRMPGHANKVEFWSQIYSSNKLTNNTQKLLRSN